MDRGGRCCREEEPNAGWKPRPRRLISRRPQRRGMRLLRRDPFCGSAAHATLFRALGVPPFPLCVSATLHPPSRPTSRPESPSITADLPRLIFGPPHAPKPAVNAVAPTRVRSSDPRSADKRFATRRLHVASSGVAPERRPATLSEPPGKRTESGPIPQPPLGGSREIGMSLVAGSRAKDGALGCQVPSSKRYPSQPRLVVNSIVPASQPTCRSLRGRDEVRKDRKSVV